jgi:hypothetical protein
MNLKKMSKILVHSIIGDSSFQITVTQAGSGARVDVSFSSKYIIFSSLKSADTGEFKINFLQNGCSECFKIFHLSNPKVFYTARSIAICGYIQSKHLSVG